MSSLLEGRIRNIVARGLGRVMLSATLHPASASRGEGGRVVKTYGSVPAQGFVESYSDVYRAKAGIPDTDVSIMLLQEGLSVKPDADSQVTVRGVRYDIVPPVFQDPAGATWTFRGRPS